MRTLLFAERWRTEVLPALLQRGERLGPAARAWRWLRAQFVVHPVERWRQRHGAGLPASAVEALYVAWQRDERAAREVLQAWGALPAGASPADAAVATLRATFARGASVRRDLQVLRAVQSLAVLDIRNYRDLVFQLGDYAADGETLATDTRLP